MRAYSSHVKTRTGSGCMCELENTLLKVWDVNKCQRYTSVFTVICTDKDLQRKVHQTDKKENMHQKNIHRF